MYIKRSIEKEPNRDSAISQVFDEVLDMYDRTLCNLIVVLLLVIVLRQGLADQHLGSAVPLNSAPPNLTVVMTEPIE